jgi:alpha-tubulin suppressor-like RCC1 family protein
VAWGDNHNNQCVIPIGLDGVIGIDCGYSHSLALKSDGTIVTWGSQSVVPEGLVVCTNDDQSYVLK